MKKLIAIFMLVIISGCITIGPRQNVKLESEIVPGKVSLETPEPLSLEVRVKNIGTSIETVSADVIRTEGLVVTPPNRTVFTLKPGESRTIKFTGVLTEDAVPGDYIIDVQVKTGSGDMVTDRANLRVVQRKGLFL